MNKEFDVFIDSPQALLQGREIELTIRELTPGPRKYNRKLVKAIVSSSADQLPGGDILWLRSANGTLFPYSWAIKVIEEIKGFIAKPPYSDTLR